MLDGYRLEPDSGCWHPVAGRPVFHYSDGDDIESRLLAIIRGATDLSSISGELARHITDWPSQYHLSQLRSNLLRPFAGRLAGRVLEVGAGCGALTRFLAEQSTEVVAIEGSPRRAAVAAARCRDAAQVRVMADAFHHVTPQATFDAVLLIGVVEYARQYYPAVDGDPVVAMIQHARRFLKADGVLVLAIENQFGLKYLAGSREDHLGIPMFGIEGRYAADGPVTFGREALRHILNAAGLPAQRWWFPFPDYKLPRVIVPEGLLADPWSARLCPLVASVLESDPQLAAFPVFDIVRAWEALAPSGLAAGLANAFLIVASSHEAAVEGIDCGYYFNTERNREFAKVVTFEPTSTGSLTVRTERLYPSYVPPAPSPLAMTCGSAATFVDGELWTSRLKRILTTEGWRLDDLIVWAERWYRELLPLTGLRGEAERSLTHLVSGALVDAIPRNLIVDDSDRACFIDQEWTLSTPLEFGYVVFRGVFSSVAGAGRVYPPHPEVPMARGAIAQAVCRGLGLSLVEADLLRYCYVERDLQNWVLADHEFGNPSALLDTQLHVMPPPLALRNLLSGQASTALDASAALRDEIATRRAQVTHLTEASAALEQKVGQITELLADRDRQILALRQAHAERDAVVAEMMQSTSWQVTRPLRFVGRLARREST